MTPLQAQTAQATADRVYLAVNEAVFQSVPDWSTAAELVTNAGYRIFFRHADRILPLSRLLWSTLAGRLDRAAVSLLPGLLGTQFILSCQPSGEAVSSLQLAHAN